MSRYVLTVSKDKYDALRPNRMLIIYLFFYAPELVLALAMQPTGYMGYPGTNYQTGFSGY